MEKICKTCGGILKQVGTELVCDCCGNRWKLDPAGQVLDRSSWEKQQEMQRIQAEITALREESDRLIVKSMTRKSWLGALILLVGFGLLVFFTVGTIAAVIDMVAYGGSVLWVLGTLLITLVVAVPILLVGRNFFRQKPTKAALTRNRNRKQELETRIGQLESTLRQNF